MNISLSMNGPVPASMLGAHAPAAPRAAALLAAADRAAHTAAACAEDVDRAARFPAEAIAALRAEGLLSAVLPADFGGEDASVTDVVNICYRLGQACASTAMIFAMHQASLACLLRHGRHQEWHAALLRRISAEQLLLASSTTEGHGGGDIRNSHAAVTHGPAGITLQRDASVISYAAQADAILTTARRSADAAPSDQVLVVFQRADLTLEPAGSWDTLGMRGTCSQGFTLHARGSAAQILPDPYSKIHARSMVPVSHLAWSGAWAGIAADAVRRARARARMASRRANATLPPGAAHYTQARATLQTLCALLASGAHSWGLASHDPEILDSFEFQSEMSMMKVQASTLALSAVLDAAQACGLAGYRNDGPHSVARHVRDVLSARLMISNDRIMGNLTGPLLLSDIPTSPCPA